MTDKPFDRLLILDLDETLIFGAASELEQPASFRVGPYHVYSRPHLDLFLATVSKWFSLAVWSSATIDYVSEIARQICPPGVEWRFVWGRDHCIQRRDPERFETVYLKDLKKVKKFGIELGRILFVDDTPSKLSRSFGNAIYVTPFEGLETDDELSRLQDYLETIRCADNYRAIEKRGWRSRM